MTTQYDAILEIDHVKELEDYPKLALDNDNLRTRCKMHHNKNTNALSLERTRRKESGMMSSMLYKFNDDISYELNNEIPRLYIKGKEVGVVSMTKHYVTDTDMPGTNSTTFVYVTKDSLEQKILSINNLGEVFHQ